jgi:hypothetical protein
MKVYGPYEHKKLKGRKFVIIHYPNGKRKSTAYARHLMEQHLGRPLTDHETVDHINNDFTDDRIENLQILSRAANASKSAKLQVKEIYTLTCVRCATEFTRPANFEKHNRKQGKAGPYCGKHCAGKASVGK